MHIKKQKLESNFSEKTPVFSSDASLIEYKINIINSKIRVLTDIQIEIKNCVREFKNAWNSLQNQCC